MKIKTQQCPECNREGYVELVDKLYPDYAAWRMGRGLLQEMLPSLTSTQREQFMTGLHPACQDAVFGKDEPI